MYDELIAALRFCDNGECDGCCKYIKGKGTECYTLLRDAADAIEELSKPRWIPVTERLPEDGIEVNIVWCNHSPVIYYQHIKDKPQTATGVYYRGKWYWWSAVVQDYLAEYGEWEPDKMDTAIEVTHWMPLPELPKEEAKNFCGDCHWYEAEEMYCFRHGCHAYDESSCEHWEPMPADEPIPAPGGKTVPTTYDLLYEEGGAGTT